MKEIVPQTEIYASFLSRLQGIYRLMDRKYREAADYYGFHCQGCEDNCCLTRFYHHTFLEYLYILNGFETLDAEMRKSIRQRASEVSKKMNAESRLMCPLNAGGLCVLYAYRPMICRLHGISHELQKPGQPAIFSPGCEVFTKLAEGKRYFKFDRTPFYMEMAGLESELRQALANAGIDTQKLKMTVAQMLSRGLQCVRP